MYLNCLVPNKPPTMPFCFVVLFCLIDPILSYSVGPTYFTVHEINKNDSDSDDVCSTQACIHAASQTLERMDLSVNPCDDFYLFACGKFVNETVIPDNEGKVNTFSVVQDKLNGQLRSLLSDAIDPNDLTPFNIARKFYKSCMKETLSGESGLAENCIKMVTNRMAIAVSSMYVRKYFPKESKAVILDMFEAIRNEFEIILNNVDWLNEGTRDKALKKLRNMSAYIGYSDELLDNSTIEKYYEDLEINEENDFWFYLSLINEKDWRAHVPSFVVNAFYNPYSNGIEIPAAILQSYFFSADRPQYMNYGAIGSILGHEVTHAFDKKRLRFQKKSRKPEIRARYLEHIKCIIEQYGNYTEPLTGLKLNGKAARDENIADGGGIIAAYLAYQKWAQTQNVPEKRLPNLNYTSQQMFWISAAQNWCSVYRQETMKKLILPESHASERFRVIVPFSNRKEFASDFQCAEGSPMNPPKKCELWNSRRSEI